MTDEFVDALTRELRELGGHAGGGARPEISTELRRKVEQRRRRGPRAVKVLASVTCIAAAGVLISRVDLSGVSSSDKGSSVAKSDSSSPVTPCVGTARAAVAGRAGGARVPSGLELYSDGSTTVLGPVGWRCVRADTYDSAVLNISKRGSSRNESVTVQYAHVNSTTGLALVCANFVEYGLQLDLTKARVDSFECATKQNEVHTSAGPQIARFLATASRADAGSKPGGTVARVVGSVIHNGASIDAGRIARLSCTLSGPGSEAMCSAIRSDYEMNRFARTAPLTPRWTKIPRAGAEIATSRAVVLDAGALRLQYQGYSTTPSGGTNASGKATLRDKFVRALQKSARPNANPLLSDKSFSRLSAAAATKWLEAKRAVRFEQAFVDETGAVYAWGNRRAVKIDAAGRTTELASFPSVRNSSQSVVIGRSLFVWGGVRGGQADDKGGRPSTQQEHAGYFMYFG